MVGRLVEHQDIPVAGEQRGKLDAAALAAAQRGDGSVPPNVGEQAADHVPRPRVARPHVLGGVAYDRVSDGERVVKGVGLAKHPSPHPAPDRHSPRVGLLPSREQGEQAGLAFPVPAYDPDPVALVQA